MKNNLNDSQRVDLARKEYDPLRVGNKIKIDDDKLTVGKVSQVNNKKSTGEQSYIVTDKGTLPTASASERANVKEVTILYRGSTGIDKIKQEPGDVIKDWIGNDLIMGTAIFNGGGAPASPQLASSADTLKETIRTYPNAKIYIYGHSLGSMNGQYALADLSQEQLRHIGGAYLYQGPNVYSTLNSKQKETVAALNKLGIINNYIDPRDIIPIGYGVNQETIGQLILVDSKKADSVGDQHMWGGYQYDKEGNILTDAKGYAALAKSTTREKLNGLEELKKIFAKSGGHLSGSEKIFLDAAEALALTQGMKMTIQYEMNELQKAFKKGMDNADELWRDTLKDARTIGLSLSESEILDTLASGGATEASIRTKPKAKYQRKITKLKAIEKDYNELINNIKHAVADQLQNDHDLAQQIGSA